jgi:hypothetical protein
LLSLQIRYNERGGKYQMLKKRKLIVIFSILFCSALIFCVTYRFHLYAGKPLLRIIVRTQGALIWGGNAEYYSVYENGGRQKLSALFSHEVEAYRVDETNGNDAEILINSNTGARLDMGSHSKLYEIVYDIIDLVKEQSQIENPNIYQLYILNERYFFDVFDDNSSFIWSFSDLVFEYLPNKGKILKIATIRSKNIEHIELYS